MRIEMTRTVDVLYLVAGLARPAVAQVDQQRAQEFFKEVQALCERDGGRLWSVSLCAPMVIADMRTQTFATRQPAPEGARPRLLGLVNAPVQWGGATWGAYIWDFVVNKTPRDRKELFLHELFHGVQPQLGLIVPALAAEHLDAVDGRYWLRLEWRALARALRDQESSAISLSAKRSRSGRPGACSTQPVSKTSAPRRSPKGSPRTRAPCSRPSLRPTRSLARSTCWPMRRRRRASFARLRTCPVPRMASCSMHRLPAGRDGCAAPTISPRL